MGSISEKFRDYERASKNLRSLISKGHHLDDELKEADRQLDRAFSEMVDWRPDNAADTSTHFHYLVQTIKALHPSDVVLTRLLDGLLRDFTSLEAINRTRSTLGR